MGFPQELLGLGPGIASTYKGNFAVEWLQIQP